MQMSQCTREGHEILAGGVVQVPRQFAAFFILQLQQPPGELPQSLFCLFALRDVADGARNKRTLLCFQRAEADLNGKLRAIFPPAVQL